MRFAPYSSKGMVGMSIFLSLRTVFLVRYDPIGQRFTGHLIVGKYAGMRHD